MPAGPVSGFVDERNSVDPLSDCVAVMSAFEALRKRFARFEDFRFCEGFRMPGAHERCHVHRRPAYENLQGRKPREALRWGCGVRYGDLSAAGEACDRGQADRVRWLKRLLRMGRSLWS